MRFFGHLIILTTFFLTSSNGTLAFCETMELVLQMRMHHWFIKWHFNIFHTVLSPICYAFNILLSLFLLLFHHRSSLNCSQHCLVPSLSRCISSRTLYGVGVVQMRSFSQVLFCISFICWFWSAPSEVLSEFPQTGAVQIIFSSKEMHI